MYLTNLHTHTTFCDGKNTVEEMTLAAIKAGFVSLGFSSHAYMQKDECSMPLDKVMQYKKQVFDIAQKYADTIKIYTGIENDSFGTNYKEGFDYVIGSTHYVDCEGVLYGVDSDVPQFINGIKAFGDAYKLTGRYFDIVSNHLESTKPDIAGHIDIVCKFNEQNNLFDENDRRYYMPAFYACDVGIENDCIFEVNTGAISRGFKTNPYPNNMILKYLFEKNAKLTLSSDTHSVDTVDFWFKQALELIKSVGYKSLWQYTDNGFCEKGI